MCHAAFLTIFSKHIPPIIWFSPPKIPCQIRKVSLFLVANKKTEENGWLTCVPLPHHLGSHQQLENQLSTSLSSAWHLSAILSLAFAKEKPDTHTHTQDRKERCNQRLLSVRNHFEGWSISPSPPRALPASIPVTCAWSLCTDISRGSGHTKS